MKRLLALVCLTVSLATMVAAQCGGEKAGAASAAKSEKAASDSTKAASNLYFVFLNRPANRAEISKEKSEEIQEGHMANIRRLASEGKLEIAGPFTDDDKKLRGIFVFKAASADEVQGWLETDPAIKGGRLEGDIHPWHPAKGEIHHPASFDGMENFVMVIYHWGPEAKSKSQAEIGEAFQEHKKYQLGLFEAGKTVIGGPYLDAEHGEYVGVVIAHGTKEDGEKLGAGDPVVKAGVAKVEVHPWMVAKGVLGTK
jgi:uncharacterized protein